MGMFPPPLLSDRRELVRERFFFPAKWKEEVEETMWMNLRADLRQEHVKLLIADAMLAKLSNSVVYNHALSNALVRNDGYRHVIDRLIERADQHRLLRVLIWTVTDVYVELNHAAVCSVIV